MNNQYMTSAFTLPYCFRQNAWSYCLLQKLSIFAFFTPFPHFLLRTCYSSHSRTKNKHNARAVKQVQNSEYPNNLHRNRTLKRSRQAFAARNRLNKKRCTQIDRDTNKIIKFKCVIPIIKNFPFVHSKIEQQ